MKRLVNYDYLRVFASLAIIILHVSASNINRVGTSGLNFTTFTIYNSAVRWGVSIFVMISGLLFLKKDVPIEKIYKKYIPRLLIAFAFWSLIYALEKSIRFGGGISFNFNGFLGNLLEGHYHMWFIFMIISLYMFIPIFKLIIKDQKTTKYLLIIAFIFTFCIPFINQIIKDFITNENVLDNVNIINENITTMKKNMLLGYPFYFILGYYLNTYEISKKTRNIFYILGIISFITIFSLNIIVTLNNNIVCTSYYSNYFMTTTLEVIAVFIWFRYHKFKDNNIIIKLSKYSFGAFMVHVLIIEKLASIFKFSTLSFYTPLSVPIIAIIVFIISYIISFILNQIPIIKKYCV